MRTRPLVLQVEWAGCWLHSLPRATGWDHLCLSAYLMVPGALPLVKPMVFAAAEALLLVILQYFALHHLEFVLPKAPKDDLVRQLVQVRLEHSKVEALHSQLECPVSPKLTFEHLARSVARLVHSPRQVTDC